MKTRRLGKTDLDVSVIGFGGIPLQGVSFERAGEILNLALDLGVRFLDTARGYTDSEEKIGAGIGHRRDEFVLATKSMARDGEAMARDVDVSLANLKTDVIDLYQIHGIHGHDHLDAVLAPGGALSALDRARQEGKIRYIGVTGHSRDAVKRAVETERFDTVQLPFNPLETQWGVEVIPAARRLGLGIIGMKPIAGGALRAVPGALRFSLTHGVDVVIPGVDDISQVRLNASVGYDLMPPTEQDLVDIEADKRRWTGLFCRRCGYCKPCSEGLDIPFLFLIEAYHSRYSLKEWAADRLAALEKKYTDCTGCKECEARCPYDLPISEMMDKAAVVLMGDKAK